MPDTETTVDHAHIWQLPNHSDLHAGVAEPVQTCSVCGESIPYNSGVDYRYTAFTAAETPTSGDKSDVAFNPAKRGPGRPRAEKPTNGQTDELDEGRANVSGETREQKTGVGDKRRQCANDCGRIAWSDGLCATCYRERYESLAASILEVSEDAKDTYTYPEPTVTLTPVGTLKVLTLGLEAMEQDLQELQAVVDSFRMVVAFYEGRPNDH